MVSSVHVIGSYRGGDLPQFHWAAAAAGELLAEAGVRVVCRGPRRGLIGAAVDGALIAGGDVQLVAGDASVTADALLALPGSVDVVGELLTAAAAGPGPAVAVNTVGFFRHLRGLLHDADSRRFASDPAPVLFADTPARAVALLTALEPCAWPRL